MRMRTIAAVAMAAAVAMGTAFATTPAQAAPSASHGPYQFKNDYSHLCMDVASGATHDGARIQQWDCYGGAPTKWRLEFTAHLNGWSYYKFVNVHSGRCLDVPNGSMDAGVELQQWGCWGGDMQQWALVEAGTGGSVTVRNRRSGLCLDVRNWGGAGASLQQWRCNQLAVQTWRFS
ncbi:RICIN domain-containing protein [Streptomyces sp. CAU 1734]|uniref:RICIN domain-containing protein n=1 Tax=Streptomyces sp. CAU 1734 TaxID=3140360 RepID=UPI003261A502